MKFKPWVENTLITINVMIGFVFVSIDDFEFEALKFMFAMVIIFTINCILLKKYGRSL